MNRKPWLVRVADSASESARRILESDLEQLAMILTTVVAAVTYGWIEGFAIETPRHEAAQVWWILGHFSTYSLAMWVLFACITGGFALIKGRSMFVKGKRYFLFAFAGNFPFSWLVEDFAFFWFSPEWRLNDKMWTNWVFGGLWILDPWREGVKIWIPNWYWPVLVFWLGMMWYAHRCTVYDNLVKDEIAREIVPKTIDIPGEVKKPDVPSVPEETAERRAPAPEEAQPVKVEPQLAPELGERVALEKAKTPRSPEAEEALEKLRSKWLRDHA